MDRSGVFVDAGHLLAQGGALCCGTGHRSEFSCSYSALIKALCGLVSTHCGLPLLRLYWYDGANNATPTLDHLTIAAEANVKLRLGRISWGRQKGVDALIYRDLMTLARERAVTTAYLLAGDEDLKEGVVAAQDMGVRVVLLGVPAVQGSNQSEFLIREADEHMVLDKTFLEPHFTKAQMVQAQAPANPMQVAGEVGSQFAVAWVDRALPDEVRRLLGQAPRIPRELDIELLSEGRKILGPNISQEFKREMRARFWDALRGAAKSAVADKSSGD